jgi:hypothetical protein
MAMDLPGMVTCFLRQAIDGCSPKVGTDPTVVGAAACLAGRANALANA